METYLTNYPAEFAGLVLAATDSESEIIIATFDHILGGKVVTNHIIRDSDITAVFDTNGLNRNLIEKPQELMCEFEDCDQSPAPDSTFCPAHKKENEPYAPDELEGAGLDRPSQFRII
jgi:hypothetical protein